MSARTSLLTLLVARSPSAAGASTREGRLHHDAARARFPASRAGVARPGALGAQGVRDAARLQPDSLRHRRLVEVEETGRNARTAVGIAELPLDIAVEIEMVVAVDASA